ncbi:uncharacterized protein LOC106013483 [Aplysia californica]|uniref:Uncharacterized protein LOC106013483 n=1 Tax=Aplysia californica TaxID=6500 RepID=A0ABM1AC03_APLCA|nr:uncharacterized protein LOC106013483 [Aplysia californica]
MDYTGPGHRFAETNPDNVGGLPLCTFYYSCINGAYIPHQKCNEGLVYSEDQQRCLPRSEVPPPCGTLDPSQNPNGGLFTGDDIPMIQPQVDSFGKTDYSRWPFTNSRSGRQNSRGRGGAPLTNFNPNDFGH